MRRNKSGVTKPTKMISDPLKAALRIIAAAPDGILVRDGAAFVPDATEPRRSRVGMTDVAVLMGAGFAEDADGPNNDKRIERVRITDAGRKALKGGE